MRIVRLRSARLRPLRTLRAAAKIHGTNHGEPPTKAFRRPTVKPPSAASSAALYSGPFPRFAMARRSFPVVVSKDEDGYWVGRVPGLHGAHSQGRTKKELLVNMKEAIALALESEDAAAVEHAVAVERVTVEA